MHEEASLQAARFGDWKAVKNGPEKPIELYDLKTDASEKNNLAAEHPAQITRAETIFREAHVEVPEWPMVADKKQRTQARQKAGLVK